jgi:GTP-binding protein
MKAGFGCWWQIRRVCSHAGQNAPRSAGKDEAVRLAPQRKMALQQMIGYIQDDELVEVTPKSIRLRKRYLDPHERKKAARAAA